MPEPLIYDQTQEIAYHPRFPHLKVAVRPQTNYPKEAQGKSTLNDYLQTKVENIPLEKDISRDLEDVHTDYKDFLTGNLHVLHHRDYIPEEYRKFDQMSFPYTRRLNNVRTDKSSSSTYTIGNPLRSLPNLIATNMLKRYIEHSSSNRQEIQNLINSHRTLYKHSPVDIRRDQDKGKTFLFSTSGLDHLKNILIRSLYESGIENPSYNFIAHLEPIASQTSGTTPIDLHNLKTHKLAHKIASTLLGNNS